MSVRTVEVVGAGPAGTSAALAARHAGADVLLYDPARFPRHKVCGEFLSPGIRPLLEELGAGSAFAAAGPAPIRRMEVNLGRKRKVQALHETAFGLSRFTFDRLLLDAAMESGVTVRRERFMKPADGQVWAAGRAARRARGGRLFGFKAHFRGVAHDAVELYFFGRSYVGVNAIENGLLNVCGIAPEEELQWCGFEADELMAKSPALAERLTGATRTMEWLHTGPLVFEQNWDPNAKVYRAGDALSFIDPFTGSGLLTAVLTGKLAGESAAKREPVAAYLSRCRAYTRSAFRVSQMLRGLAGLRVSELLLDCVPGSVLFKLTRPSAY